MFRNIGKKLCGLAKLLAALGVIATVIGLVCLVWGILDAGGMILVGSVCILSGMTTVIATWPLYAFGQLTEDVHAIRVMACDQPEPTYSLDEEYPAARARVRSPSDLDFKLNWE